MLIEALPPTCDTWVALGADPWTLGDHLLHDIANSARSLDAITFNVNRDRDKVPEPRKYEPIPGPERVLTPEQKAAEDARQLAERQRQELEEVSAMVTHDIGAKLFSGQLTMLELSRQIRASGGLN